MRVTVCAILCLVFAGVVSANRTIESERTSLRGRVYDLLGSPIEGVRLTVLAANEKYETQTDKNGNYLFPKLEPGNVEFAAVEAGFYKYERRLYLNPGVRSTFDVGLQVGFLGDIPKLTVRGSVRNHKGKSIEDASIIATCIFNDNVRVFGRSSKTGSFEIQLPTYGQYSIFAVLKGYKVDVRILLVDKEKNFVANLTLNPL
jgi:hypothetical protein